MTSTLVAMASTRDGLHLVAMATLEAMEEQLMMCSPFFVLDNTIADAYKCEEEVRSTLVWSELLLVGRCSQIPCLVWLNQRV